MKGKMKAFPIPPSITYKTYGIFEHIACDIIDFNRKNCRGYRYLFLFIDKAPTKTFPKFSSRKFTINFLNALKELIQENGAQPNPKSLDIRYLQSDYDDVIKSSEVLDYLTLNNITLRCSEPYEHQQNLAERYVYTIKDGIRTIMNCNRAHVCYYCYAG